jgi:phospholipase/carboxylesterase
MVISVRAPYPFQYSEGYTWYDFNEIGTPDPTMFRSSYQHLTTFLEDILNGYPVDRNRLFLFGFSMGTMMAFAIALTKPGLIRGVVGNSGYIPERAGLDFTWSEVSGTSFFVAHGTHDPVIPVEMARRTHELLKKTNAPLTYHEYPMGHEISQESLDDAVTWLDTMLKGQSRNAG